MQSRSMPDVESPSNPNFEIEKEVNSEPNPYLPLMMFHPLYGFSENVESGFPNPEHTMSKGGASHDHSSELFFHDDPYQEASAKVKCLAMHPTVRIVADVEKPMRFRPKKLYLDIYTLVMMKW